MGRLIVPDGQSEVRRRQQVSYAAEAAAGLVRSRGRSGTAVWSSRGWLQSHLVVVSAVADGQLHQCHVVREQSRLHGELVRGRRIVIARLEPNYFAATARAGELLDELAPWRVLPGPAQVARGRTQCWLPQAPAREFLVGLPPA